MDEKLMWLEEEVPAPPRLQFAVERNLDNLRLISDVSTVYISDLFETLFEALHLWVEEEDAPND